MVQKKIIGLLLGSLLLGITTPTYADVYVKGYFRNGKYVKPHYRSDPDGNFYNNWSTKGNTNPYTGKKGTKTHPGYSSGSGYSVPFSHPASNVQVPYTTPHIQAPYTVPNIQVPYTRPNIQAPSSAPNLDIDQLEEIQKKTIEDFNRQQEEFDKERKETDEYSKKMKEETNQLIKESNKRQEELNKMIDESLKELERVSQTKVRALEVPDFNDVDKTLEGPDLTPIDFEDEQTETNHNKSVDAHPDQGKASDASSSLWDKFINFIKSLFD